MNPRPPEDSSLFVPLNVGLIALAAAASLAVYRNLPSRMAIHFDAYGEPNGWADRSVGALALPLVSLAAFLVVGRVPRVPALIATAATALLTALHLAMLRFALGGHSAMLTVLPLALGLFMLLLGHLLPRTRQNRYVGVRTRWTMRSAANWHATHRFASLAFTLAGFAALAAGAFARNLALLITVVALTASSIAVTAYSFYFAQRKPTP